MKELRFHELQNETEYEVRALRSPRKHFWTLIVVGAALLGVGAVFLSNDYAGARGGGGLVNVMLTPTGLPEAPSSSSSSAPAHRMGRGLAVCVRLCDGYFFPSNAASGGDEACNEQCPDAPSAFYTESAGSDDIGSAVSTSGALYAELPVAFRFRSTVDDGCTCHRKSASYSAMLLRDRTLRKGDIVMTPKGLVVYEGSNTPAVRWQDFVSLADAPSVPSNIRADLSKLRSGNVEGWYGSSYATASANSSSSSSPDAVSSQAKGISFSVVTPALRAP